MKKMSTGSSKYSCGRTRYCVRLLTMLVPILLFKNLSLGQDPGNLNLKGKISGPDGLPVPGVNVIVKGTTMGVATDAAGNFSMSVPATYGDSTLVISALGFNPQEIKIKNQTNFSIRLKDNTKSLNEVVVIGYGTRKKKDLTGSVSSLTAKDVEENPVLSVNQALQGRAAGVQVVQNSGAPGAYSTIRIRGVGTLSNSNPLYVVDGLPMSADDIGFLSPNDIESVDILKDASASAIYGARAANGVVLVTTKKGKAGKTNITYDFYKGIQSPWRKLNLTSAEQWATLKNEARFNDGKEPEKGFENPASFGTGTDWQKEVFRNALIENHHLAASGGSEKLTYYTSGDYIKQQGIVHGTDAKRISYRLNVDYRMRDKLKVGSSLNFIHNTASLIQEAEEFNSVIVRTLRIDPATPVYNPDGSFASSPYNNIDNPLATINYNTNVWKNYRLVGGLFGEYEFIEGLKLRSSLSSDFGFANNYGFSSSYNLSPDEKRDNNSVHREYIFARNLLWENIVSYQKTFKERHNISLVGGITSQDFHAENIYASKDKTATNDPDQQYLSSASTSPETAGGASEWALLSYLARGNYILDDKYLFTASIRIDGSSRFIGDNRWGVFPSFAGGWRISKENFFQNVPYVSELKLRGSWGQLGNQDLGNGSINSFYPYTTTIANRQDYVFGNPEVKVSGSAPLSSGNSEIKWETVTQTDIGLDIGLLDNKVTVTTDYFYRITSDMLVAKPVPGHVGLQNNPYVNAGEMVNKGLEFSATYRQILGKFDISSTANIAFINNKVTSLGNGGEAMTSGDFRGSGYISRTDVDHPVASFYGYVTDGIFQNEAEVKGSAQADKARPGDVRFKDLNGDGKIDDKDRTYIGSPWPKFTYGWTSRVEYSGFDLSFLFQGSYGNKIYNGTRYYLEGTGFDNFSANMLNRWTGEGTSNTTPRVTENDPNNNRRISDRFVESGSYLRLKMLQFGYTLPTNIANYAKLAKVRVYVSSYNLLTWTGYSGLDPEVGMGRYGALDFGIDRGTYPQARSFIAGVNVTF